MEGVIKPFGARTYKSGVTSNILSSSNKFIKRQYSKDQLRSFTWNKDHATVYPNFSFDAVVKMLDSDPIARGALTHYVDRCMEGDYSIIKKETRTYDREFEDKLDSAYNFRTQILRKIFLLGKLYNNVYIEIVRTTDNTTKAINVLDSTNIDVITEPNGDVIEFKSKTPSAKNSNDYPTWDKNDIVWIKFNDRSIGYAPLDLKALWENLVIKDYIKRYVAWLWQTGQYRVLYNIKSGASDTDITDFLTYARKNDDNFKAPFVLKGELELKMVRDLKETDSITSFLKYLDNQTLVLLRIPPNDAGLPDQSGRSNADAQSNNLSTHTIASKKIVEDYLNGELFPKMNKGNSLIVFGPTDRFAEKQVFENVNIMKNIGMSEDLIKEYLQDRGMFFGTEELFEDPVEKQLEMNEALGVPSIGPNGQKKDINTMPSRLKSVDKKSGDGVSTREDQLKKV